MSSILFDDYQVHPLKISKIDKNVFDQLNLSEFNLERVTTIAAGGSALSWFIGNPLNNSDIDLWFATRNDYLKYLNYLYEINATLVFESNNAITFKLARAGEPHVYRKTIIQLIKNPFNDNIRKILSEFDITVCKVATDGTRIYMDSETYFDIQNNILRITGKLKPNIIKRMFKYMVYGYNISNEQMDMVINYYADNKSDVQEAISGDIDEYEF